MRIIAGKYKGHRLFTATSHIRPTTDRIKEHIFSIAGPYLENQRVCDLFAGSGSLGLECLSRSADPVVFVEKSFQSIQVLKKNLQRIMVPKPWYIENSEVLAFLRNNTEPFDFIFADPPFRWPFINELFEQVFKPQNLKPQGIFILESERSHQVQWESDVFEIVQQKKFDRSIITFSGWRIPNE